MAPLLPPLMVGMLVVDIFDGQTQKLIWRAQESDALSGIARQMQKKLANDPAGMFKHFPSSQCRVSISRNAVAACRFVDTQECDSSAH
ncbi:MAG: hypothetical protein JWQ49_5117 [Edaphobacter sp.]|nr:hypothetical protein [Edaphobacter sp.]